MIGVDIASENFAFEEHLVRVTLQKGEPWFVAGDVCQALELKNTAQALDGLDDDEKDISSSDTLGGRQEVWVISEPGVYRLVFRSRKPAAERFKRWLAHEVLPQLRRRGRYHLHEPEPVLLTAAESLLHRLQVVREARVLFGRERARNLWRDLQLPAVPPPAPTAVDEARDCLRHLLDAAAFENGPAIRALLAGALDEDEQDRALLIASCIKAYPERDQFVVANRHPFLTQVYCATAWAGPLGHVRVLRRLPGAQACGPQRWQGAMVRGTLLSGELLDDI